MSPNSKLLFLVAAISLSLSACDGKKTETAVDSKPAVKINGQSVLEVEIQTKSAHGGADGKTKPVSEQSMESLVNMELMRQAAVQSKLDRDPAIQAKLANSARSILAMAYMEQQLAAAAKPTEADILAYYNQHPERYAQRKQYAVQEIQIEAAPDVRAEIKQQLEQLKTLDQFEPWLKAKDIPHQSLALSVSSDQMSDEVLPKLTKAPVGGHVILDSKEPLLVIFVRSEQLQPMPLEQAGQQIGNTLLEQRRKAALDNALKQLRDKAKIEYVAPYTAKGLQVSEKRN